MTIEGALLKEEKRCRRSTFQHSSLPKHVSTVCSPEDLLSPGVDWDPTPIITNGQGVYSFPGGNVTYNGVSLGSTATYRTSEGYLVNGEQILEILCGELMW